MHAFDDEPIGSQLRGSLRANQKRYITPGLAQATAEVTAGGTGANDKNAHAEFPLATLPIVTAAPRLQECRPSRPAYPGASVESVTEYFVRMRFGKDHIVHDDEFD